MNTQSRVLVDYSRDARIIHLKAGQALFSVAHDSQRPFRVYVDGSAVQAIGTKFDVRRWHNETSIAVIEGHVQVSSKTALADMASLHVPPTKLAAGEGIKILNSGELTPPTPISVKDTTAWQQRRLIFVDLTINDILTEFERYTRTQIRIEDPALAQLRFSGVWDADRPDVLLTYLSKYGHVRVEHEGDGFVLRSRSSATSR